MSLARLLAARMHCAMLSMCPLFSLVVFVAEEWFLGGSFSLSCLPLCCAMRLEVVILRWKHGWVFEELLIGKNDLVVVQSL